MKYIVKKCLNLATSFYADGSTVENECSLSFNTEKGNCLCEDSKCLLKDIIEKCKNYKEDCKIMGNCLDDRLCDICFLGGANELCDWILSDLEIEEVSE